MFIETPAQGYNSVFFLKKSESQEASQSPLGRQTSNQSRQSMGVMTSKRVALITNATIPRPTETPAPPDLSLCLKSGVRKSRDGPGQVTNSNHPAHSHRTSGPSLLPCQSAHLCETLPHHHLPWQPQQAPNWNQWGGTFFSTSSTLPLAHTAETTCPPRVTHKLSRYNDFAYDPYH